MTWNDPDLLPMLQETSGFLTHPVSHLKRFPQIRGWFE